MPKQAGDTGQIAWVNSVDTTLATQVATNAAKLNTVDLDAATTAVDANPASAYRVQADARQNATFAPVTGSTVYATPASVDSRVAANGPDPDTALGAALLAIMAPVAMAANGAFAPSKLAAESFTAGWSAVVFAGTVPFAGGFTGTVTTDTISWASAFAANQQLLYKSATIGVKYDATMETSATVAGGFASVVIASTDSTARSAEWRFSVGSGVITRLVNNAGSTVLPAILGNQNSYTIPTPGGAILSARIVSATDVEIFINDQLVERYTVPFSISRVGFGVSFDASAAMLVRRPVRWDASRPSAHRNIKFSAIGDSQGVGFGSPLNFADLLPVALAGIPGGGGAQLLNNYAVSGTASSSWGAGGANDVATKDFTGCNYVLVNLGTNDVAGAVSYAVLSTALTYIGAQIVAAGAVPVFGLWPQYNDESLNGGAGVNTTNYSLQAKYRSLVVSICANNGYPLADINAVFGNNPQWFHDNIHPSPVGAAAFAKAYAAAIANHNGGDHRETYAQATPWTTIPTAWFSNSWASFPAQYRLTADGTFEMRGRINGGTPGALTAITIPAEFRPPIAYAAKTRAVSGSTEVIGTINITAAGALVVSEGGTTLTALDGVRYSTV